MRVFVAGASGAIGEPLIAELLERGYSVVGMTTSEARAKNLEGSGRRGSDRGRVRCAGGGGCAAAVESGSGNRRIDVAAEGAERYAQIRCGQ